MAVPDPGGAQAEGTSLRLRAGLGLGLLARSAWSGRRGAGDITATCRALLVIRVCAHSCSHLWMLLRRLGILLGPGASCFCSEWWARRAVLRSLSAREALGLELDEQVSPALLLLGKEPGVRAWAWSRKSQQ